MGIFSGGVTGSMIHSLKQNKALRLKRKSLKDLRDIYHSDDHIKKNPKFKKASSEEMKAFKLKLEKEKKLNLKKKMIVISVLAVIGFLALYYIISG
jgi:hypothetical protein